VRLLKFPGEQRNSQDKSANITCVQLLMKSGAVGSSSSISSSQSTRGEVTDIEHVVECEPTSDELQRCSSWASFPLPPVEPKKWMLSPNMEHHLQQTNPHARGHLQTHAGQIMQMMILLLVICTYAACPLTVSWAKVVGMDNEVPIKGRPFKESSIIVVSWALIAFVGLALSAVTGGYRSVAQCLDKRAILMFAPAGAGWAIADVCEVLAVTRIDPATYGVISQARLLGSAAACWLMRGIHQTQLQWGVLGALTLVCMAYCVIPDVPAKSHALTEQQEAQTSLNEQIVGFTFALGKVALSVLSGVYGERCFKAASADGNPSGLHIQMTQISFSSMVSAFIGYCVICNECGEDVWDFFGGPDGAWDYRTVLLSCIYCWREWICNLCVKRFDSLVKNICNAVSLVVTYVITVAASREKTFSALKVMLLFTVVAQVVNYSATRRSVTTAVKTSDEEAPRKMQDCETVANIPVAEYRHGLSRPARTSGHL